MYYQGHIQNNNKKKTVLEGGVTGRVPLGVLKQIKANNVH